MAPSGAEQARSWETLRLFFLLIFLHISEKSCNFAAVTGTSGLR